MLKQLICWLKNLHLHNYVDDYRIDFLCAPRLTVTTYCNKCGKQYFEKVYMRNKLGSMVLKNTSYKYGFRKHVINNVNDFIMPKGRWK